MAEGGVKSGPCDSDEDRGIQELERELEDLREEIRKARKRQDKEQLLRRQIEEAKKELATITGIEKGESYDIKVAFTAVVSPPHLVNLGAGQPIVYDRVITNLGNAYDNIIGIFTAPVGAVYIFEMTLMTDPGWWQYLELVPNGEHIMWNYGQGANQLDSSSRTVTIELLKGTKVWIRTQNRPTHGVGKVHGNSFSTFSGWLYTPLK